MLLSCSKHSPLSPYQRRASSHFLSDAFEIVDRQLIIQTRESWAAQTDLASGQQHQLIEEVTRHNCSAPWDPGALLPGSSLKLGHRLRALLLQQTLQQQPAQRRTLRFLQPRQLPILSLANASSSTRAIQLGRRAHSLAVPVVDPRLTRRPILRSMPTTTL